MRSSFGADWAFGIKGAIENTVRRAFPGELRRWPVLQTFNFEAYRVGTAHFVIVMRDKLSGFVAGPGVSEQFPFNDHPSLPPSAENIEQWTNYLTRRFELRTDDVAMILPIHDSGHSSASADFDMFTEDERQLWNHQLNVNIARQMSGLGVSADSSSSPPVNVIYNVSGANARVNISSTDNSSNVIQENGAQLFGQMIEALRGGAADSIDRITVENAISQMAAQHKSTGFGAAYKNFMSVLADHLQIYGPILAPFLPMLAGLAV